VVAIVAIIILNSQGGSDSSNALCSAAQGPDLPPEPISFLNSSVTRGVEFVYFMPRDKKFDWDAFYAEHPNPNRPSSSSSSTVNPDNDAFIGPQSRKGKELAMESYSEDELHLNSSADLNFDHNLLVMIEFDWFSFLFSTLLLIVYLCKYVFPIYTVIITYRILKE
jgi:hypothetical protein